MHRYQSHVVVPTLAVFLVFQVWATWSRIRAEEKGESVPAAETVVINVTSKGLGEGVGAGLSVYDPTHVVANSTSKEMAVAVGGHDREFANAATGKDMGGTYEPQPPPSSSSSSSFVITMPIFYALQAYLGVVFQISVVMLLSSPICIPPILNSIIANVERIANIELENMVGNVFCHVFCLGFVQEKEKLVESMQ